MFGVATSVRDLDIIKQYLMEDTEKIERILESIECQNIKYEQGLENTQMILQKTVFFSDIQCKKSCFCLSCV